MDTSQFFGWRDKGRAGGKERDNSTYSRLTSLNDSMLANTRLAAIARYFIQARFFRTAKAVDQNIAKIEFYLS